MRSVYRRLSRVASISSMEQYESVKTAHNNSLVVGWWYSSWSTPAKVFEPEFDKLAESFPDVKFFKADIDTVPTAAYDMEVTGVPQISVLPVGVKPGPDAHLYDKSDLRRISVEGDLDYSKLFSRLRETIGEIKFNKDVEDPRAVASWAFDPATGTTVPRHQLY